MIYLLKSTCILGLLLIFYRIFLEREAIHNFKRFFLLGAVLVAILIPSIEFTTYVQPVQNAFPTQNSGVFLLDQTQDNLDILMLCLWSIYALGVLIFGFRFAKNLYALHIKIKYGQKIRTRHYIYVLLDQFITEIDWLKSILF